MVAERRLEVAAEAVRGGEAARGEDEERRHLFGGSKFIFGARRNQSILTDAKIFYFIDFQFVQKSELLVGDMKPRFYVTR